MTTFEEFIGYKKILGASWMLPIMVVFFAILTIGSSAKFVSRAFCAISVGAIACGIARYASGRPFPTALFLLQLVGLIGFMMQGDKEDGVDTPGLGPKGRIAIFEAVLLVSAWLSYGSMVVWYFIAYNFGMLMFYLFMHENLTNKWLDKLGALGFTFFLGPDIPVVALSRLFSLDVETIHPAIRFVATFALVWLFSYCVTRWIERPLLRLGKDLERRLA